MSHDARPMISAWLCYRLCLWPLWPPHFPTKKSEVAPKFRAKKKRRRKREQTMMRQRKWHNTICRKCDDKLPLVGRFVSCSDLIRYGGSWVFLARRPLLMKVSGPHTHTLCRRRKLTPQSTMPDTAVCCKTVPIMVGYLFYRVSLFLGRF